jgi:ABC-type glycerol-3-phosphate transport system permease component
MGIKRKRVGMLTLVICNLVFLIIMLLPMIMPIGTSLGRYGSMFGRLFPADPTLENYMTVWTHIPLANYILNSFVYSGLSVLVSLVPALFGAYWASRVRNRLRGVFLYGLLLIEMVGIVIIIVPMIKMASLLNLIDKTAGVVLFTAAILIPFSIMLMSGFLESVPVELEEAAQLDGCSRLGAFFRVVLPLAVPGLVVTLIFSFITAWQEFLIPLTLINSPEKLPAVVGVYWLADKAHPYWELVMAGSMICVLPILILFILIQKYIVKGIMKGAVKG